MLGRRPDRPEPLALFALTGYGEGVHAEAPYTLSPAMVAQVRARLSRLEPVIRSLEDAGQTEDAAAVRLARRLAERALRQQDDPALLTTRQAGRALGVSIQTIRNWVEAGRLAAERRGTRTMIPRQVVLDEIDRSRARPSVSVRSAEDESAIVARRQRLLARLPQDIVDQLRRLHDQMEAGEELTADELERLVDLEDAMAAAAANVMRDEIVALDAGSSTTAA